MYITIDKENQRNKISSILHLIFHKATALLTIVASSFAECGSTQSSNNSIDISVFCFFFIECNWSLRLTDFVDCGACEQKIKERIFESEKLISKDGKVKTWYFSFGKCVNIFGWALRHGTFGVFKLFKLYQMDAECTIGRPSNLSQLRFCRTHFSANIWLCLWCSY